MQVSWVFNNSRDFDRSRDIFPPLWRFYCQQVIQRRDESDTTTTIPVSVSTSKSSGSSLSILAIHTQVVFDPWQLNPLAAIKYFYQVLTCLIQSHKPSSIVRSRITHSQQQTTYYQTSPMNKVPAPWVLLFTVYSPSMPTAERNRQS